MQENAERCENPLGEVGEIWGTAFAPCSRENEMIVKYKITIGYGFIIAALCLLSGSLMPLLTLPLWVIVLMNDASQP